MRVVRLLHGLDPTLGSILDPLEGEGVPDISLHQEPGSRDLPLELRRLLALVSTSRTSGDLKELCSEEFSGRSSASGNALVAEWIESRLSGIGLRPNVQAFAISSPVSI